MASGSAIASTATPVVAPVRSWPSRSASISATSRAGRVVKPHVKPRPLAGRGVTLPADQPQIGGRGAHRVQDDARRLRPSPRHVLGFAGGQAAKGLFANLDRQFACRATASTSASVR